MSARSVPNSEAQRLRLNVSAGELAGLACDNIIVPWVCLSRPAWVRCRLLFTHWVIAEPALNWKKLFFTTVIGGDG